MTITSTFNTKKLSNSFAQFDMYGHKVDLYINKQKTIKSKFGACITLCVFAWCFYLCLVTFLAWTNNENFQTIYSTRSFSVQDMLAKNETQEYIFNYEIYNIYFALYASLLNGTNIPFSQLERYLVKKFFYRQKKLKNFSKKRNFFLTKNSFFSI